MVTERWKCPDCSAWVRDDVEEHTCEVKVETTPVPSPWQWTGWTCARCGSFVTTGNYHACWTWNPNGTSPYYGSWTVSNSGNTRNFTLYTNDNTVEGDEDDGLDGVAVS